jgi:Zn-dependent protease
MEPTFEVLPPGPPSGSGPRYTSGPRGPNVPKPKGKGIAGVAMVVLVALAKFKYLLLAGLKTSLSMLISIGFYAMLFGWRFAVGFVVLLLVHEMGHVFAAFWLKIPVSAPLFVPFLGAAIVMKQNPRDAWTEALMGYGGPFLGTVGCWVCWALALYFQAKWLMAVAAVSFILNLFNMIPFPPLDGGRICAAVSPWFWIIGLLMLVGAIVYFHSINSIFIIVLILIYGFPRLKATLFGPRTGETQAYHTVPIFKRLSMALLYLGLIAVQLYGYLNANLFLRPAA